MTTNNERLQNTTPKPTRTWARWMAPGLSLRKDGPIRRETNRELSTLTYKLEAALEKLGQFEFRHAQRLLEAVYQARLTFGPKMPENVAQEILEEMRTALGVWGEL